MRLPLSHARTGSLLHGAAAATAHFSHGRLPIIVAKVDTCFRKRKELVGKRIVFKVRCEMPIRRRLALQLHSSIKESIRRALNTFPGTHRDTNTQSIMTSTTVSSCSVKTRFLEHNYSLYLRVFTLFKSFIL